MIFFSDRGEKIIERQVVCATTTPNKVVDVIRIVLMLPAIQRVITNITTPVCTDRPSFIEIHVVSNARFMNSLTVNKFLPIMKVQSEGKVL